MIEHTQKPPLKVALIYDWADTTFGGAENVLLTLQKLYPQAELFVSFADFKHVFWLNKFTKVHVSFLQKWPRWCKKNKAFLAPFMPYAFECFDLSGFQLVIAVSSFAAKGVLTKPNQLFICYLLTPTRFLFSHQHTYLSWWKKLLSAPVRAYLRAWDKVAIHRPDVIIAISELVARRCQKFYGRRVDEVIYPTIIPKNFLPPTSAVSKDYFLVVSRLVPYKKIALVVRSCGELGLPLKVIGSGTQLTSLKKMVKKNRWNHIKFLANVDNHLLPEYYRHAIALIAPAKEDFGINLLEANSCGTLVVTHCQSGARELLNEQVARDLSRADLASLKKLLKQFCTDEPKDWSVKFLGYNTNSFMQLFKSMQEKYYASQKS